MVLTSIKMIEPKAILILFLVFFRLENSVIVMITSIGNTTSCCLIVCNHICNLTNSTPLIIDNFILYDMYSVHI